VIVREMLERLQAFDPELDVLVYDHRLGGEVELELVWKCHVGTGITRLVVQSED
jgi:hypothetical protein